MICNVKCDCNERVGVSVNSIKLFEELKGFFEEQVESGLFLEDTNKNPFYVWRSKEGTVEHFATKWYRCRECGCLWEFNYPDFPAQGFVRKFENGIHTRTEIVDGIRRDAVF